MTNREELHSLIEQLSDAEIERWLAVVRQNQHKSTREKMLEWLEGAEQFQAKLYAKYGEMNV